MLEMFILKHWANFCTHAQRGESEITKEHVSRVKCFEDVLKFTAVEKTRGGGAHLSAICVLSGEKGIKRKKSMFHANKGSCLFTGLPLQQING